MCCNLFTFYLVTPSESIRANNHISIGIESNHDYDMKLLISPTSLSLIKWKRMGSFCHLQSILKWFVLLCLRYKEVLISTAGIRYFVWTHTKTKGKTYQMVCERRGFKRKRNVNLIRYGIQRYECHWRKKEKSFLMNLLVGISDDFDTLKLM